MDAKKPILPYEYLKGNEFVERLKEALNCRSHQELSDILQVPKSTFSTWSKHERTSHELMVRLHLALGIPIEELALYPEDRNQAQTVDQQKKATTYPSTERLVNPQHDTVIVKSSCLSNGKLIETGEVPYAVRRMNSFGLDADLVVEIETNEAIYLVDQSVTTAVSGKFLIDIDGSLSINHIQRLPGKKLAVVFGDSTVEVSDDDIKVIGRVAVSLRKD